MIKIAVSKEQMENAFLIRKNAESKFVQILKKLRL